MPTKTRRDHFHAYVDHPNWETHVACRLCGLAISRIHLRYAIDHGATYEGATAKPVEGASTGI